MNIADIEKVANRKRINAEAEKLREKVTKETTNIIKLKVAQDTAYWDLKEKLHQLENNHERLQQNMVEVQMQHEAISGQYQDELRLRPETLNKLSSTREICDVLEEYSERLKATLSRCKSDQATLAEAYNKSGQLVRDIKDKQIEAEEKSRQVIVNLQEKVKLITDHKEQMTQVFTSSKQQLEAELVDVRAKLATAMGQKDELFVALNDFSRKLDHCKRELEKKDENITSLQTDMKKLILEFNNEASEMKNILSKQEKDLKDYSETSETLKKALHNQEQFTKSICDQNNQLQEKISTLEEDQISNLDKLRDLAKKLEEANNKCDLLIREKETLNEKVENLEQLITDKLKLLEQSEIEKQNLTAHISSLEARCAQVATELEAAIHESKLKSDKNTELASVIQELETKLAEVEIASENFKVDNANKINELNTMLENKDKAIEEKELELNCKASTINQLMSDLKNLTDAKSKLDSELDRKVSTINKLMSDLKNVTDAKAKLEHNIEKLKKDMEVERDSAKEKEKAWGKKVEQLEISARDKENELSKQMTIILDIRNEKERLQERLKGMQNTIDNIEKEVTGRSALPAREAAELDDNAVMMTPASLRKKIGIHAPKIQKPSEMGPPKDEAHQDSMLFNLFSDSSMENELAIDSDGINRRFDALTRGERISPLPFKRRSGGPVTLGGLKPISDKEISLSQAKETMKNKRSFFKSKRADNKVKKFKQGD